MKKLLFAAICVLFIAGCQRQGTPKDGVQETVIRANTMVCGSCAKTVTKALEGVNGVKEVAVDMKTKTVNVKYVPDQTNLEALETAVTRAGYDANDRKRDAAAYEKLDACCKKD